MNPVISRFRPRTKLYLGACLAALVTVAAPSTWAADSDDVKQLQEELAALRARLAVYEGAGTSAPVATTAPVATSAQPSATVSTLATDDDVTVLSPYQVADEKDTGYLKTNSVTATRINMPIQNVPITVSVMSKDFIDDANIRSITDVLRYTSSGSGDNSFAMARPSNSATPQGQFTIRGFGVNSLLRNGVSRYLGYNVNNVDRIEIVKGPASVFFGAGYPGGVINYITKQPVFGKIPTTLQHTYGDNNLNRVVLDHNVQFSKKAAMRVIGSWENSGGERNFEFTKSNSLTANMTLVPFDSGKVRITGEIETYDSKLNKNRYDWIYPDGWFQAYTNPSAALISASGVANAAAYRTRIFASPANYIADVRKAAGDPSLPLYTRSIAGAYYTAADGSRIKDEGFNYTNRGSYVQNKADTTSFTVEVSPFEWMDARYVYTHENGIFDDSTAIIIPNADGRTFNAQNSLSSSGYYRDTKNHQFDVIFKKDTWGVKHKLLIGGIFQEQMQQYNANSPLSPNYSQIPGATNALGNPGVVINGTIGTGGTLAPWVSMADVPVNQVIRDRFGNIKTVQQVFTQWDPGAEIHPDSSKLLLANRNLLDGYYMQDQSGYINYNATMLDDRLTLLAGVRREMHRDSGQYLVSNFPWYAPGNYAFTDTVTYPPDVYNYTVSYAGDSNGFMRQAGTSWMSGVSFSVRKDLNVFASYSKTFRLNTGVAGGISELTIPEIAAAALANNGGSFQYRGQTITSAAEFRDALVSAGALAKVKNETGFNAELGVKTSLWDNKLTGTFSVFRAERRDQKLDDSQAQANAQESLNYSTTVFAPGSVFYNARNLRWRSVGVHNRVEGADFEFVWTPVRNFQSVINGAWMWTAKTLSDPRYTEAYKNASAANAVFYDLYYGSRIENTPEYRLNTMNKYTFTDGFVSGLSIGVGARYSSSTVYSRSIDWNPKNGGFTAGNFMVFDLTIGYPWEVLGYKVSSQVGIYNLTDKEYFEGSYVASPRRSWLLSNTLKF